MKCYIFMQVDDINKFIVKMRRIDRPDFLICFSHGFRGGS